MPLRNSSNEARRALSLVEDDPPLRWQRAVSIAPPQGLGVARRAAIFALVSWLPIAIWAAGRGRFLTAPIGEPLLQHYGVHVRCLIAMPLMILGDATLHAAGVRYLPQFIRNGLVDEAGRPAFDAVLRAVQRWRNAPLPWLLLVGVAVGWALVDPSATHTDEVSWALNTDRSLGFGGLWFAYVVRPLFVALLLGWLWRIGLLVRMFAHLGRLRLSLVPTHPDRAGGLGFVERLPGAFAPVSLAISATLASRWAHQIVYHGQTLSELKLPAAAFVIVWSLILLSPLLPLMRIMRLTRRAALGSYAAMVAEQGRLVQRRWVEGTTRTDTPLIEPSGVGVIADAETMFKAVQSMRSIAIGKTAISGILLPVAVPMLAVATLQIPIRELLLGLLKALL